MREERREWRLSCSCARAPLTSEGDRCMRAVRAQQPPFLFFHSAAWGGEGKRRVAWLSPRCSRNPHDKTVVAWGKVALQRDRGWAGEKVVRRRCPSQASSEIPCISAGVEVARRSTPWPASLANIADEQPHDKTARGLGCSELLRASSDFPKLPSGINMLKSRMES
jgi:hypothetical protein